MTENKTRIRCRDIMSTNVTIVAAGATLSDAAKLLREGDIGILPVVDTSGVLVGLITDRDIVVRAVADGKDINITTVGETMTSEIYSAEPDDFVFSAVRIMGDRKVRRVPIVDLDGVLKGIVSMADVALEMEDEREIAETLEEISSGTAFWNK